METLSADKKGEKMAQKRAGNLVELTAALKAQMKESLMAATTDRKMAV